MEKPLGELIDKLLETYNLNEKRSEVQLAQNWSEVVGTMIASYTSNIKVTGETLIITLSSAPLKNELNYLKGTLIQKINAYLGKEQIKELIIR